MSIEVRCDACGKQLSARDDAAGTLVCSDCGVMIPTPALGPVAALETRVTAEADLMNFLDVNSQPSQARRPCPVCGELIAAAARKCRFCDEILDAEFVLGRRRNRRRAPGQSRSPYPIANLGQRFLGAFIDGFGKFVCIVPGYILMIWASLDQQSDTPEIALIGLLIVLMGGLTLLALNLYLLATRSQSIGKWFVNTQITDYETGEPATFAKTFVLRGMVNSFIAGIPCVGPMYALVDICMIFGEERRCIHDQIAGTEVVDISQGPLLQGEPGSNEHELL